MGAAARRAPGPHRYTILSSLHRGGMGEILLAQAEGPQGFVRKVVLKGLLAHVAHEDLGYQLFMREARLMAQFDHPNIVRVFDLVVIDGWPYMAMEYLRGRNFHQVIQRSVACCEDMPFRIALHVVAEALRGLHYSHTLTDEQQRPLEIVHRDVTPGNLLLSFFGEVKITDFGIAKTFDAPRDTAPKSIRGKARYVAPEQVYGEAASVQSDVYSAGVVLAEAIIGAPLWERATVPETLLAIVSEDRAKTIERVLEGRKDMSDMPGLRDALERALALSRGDRYASALEFAEALEVLENNVGGPCTHVELGRYLHALYKHAPDLPPAEMAASSTRTPTFEESPYDNEDPTLIEIAPQFLVHDERLEVRASSMPVAQAVMIDSPITDPNRSSFAFRRVADGTQNTAPAARSLASIVRHERSSRSGRLSVASAPDRPTEAAKTHDLAPASPSAAPQATTYEVVPVVPRIASESASGGASLRTTGSASQGTSGTASQGASGSAALGSSRALALAEGSLMTRKESPVRGFESSAVDHEGTTRVARSEAPALARAAVSPRGATPPLVAVPATPPRPHDTGELVHRERWPTPSIADSLSGVRVRPAEGDAADLPSELPIRVPFAVVGPRDALNATVRLGPYEVPSLLAGVLVGAALATLGCLVALALG